MSAGSLAFCSGAVLRPSCVCGCTALVRYLVMSHYTLYSMMLVSCGLDPCIITGLQVMVSSMMLCHLTTPMLVCNLLPQGRGPLLSFWNCGSCTWSGEHTELQLLYSRNCKLCMRQVLVEPGDISNVTLPVGKTSGAWHVACSRTSVQVELPTSGLPESLRYYAAASGAAVDRHSRVVISHVRVIARRGQCHTQAQWATQKAGFCHAALKTSRRPDHKSALTSASCSDTQGSLPRLCLNSGDTCHFSRFKGALQPCQRLLNLSDTGPLD